MTEYDKIMHKALLKVLAEADFTLKLREVSTFSKVMQWVQEMPNNWKTVPTEDDPPKSKLARKKKE